MTARPMIIRCISDVSSELVKLVGMRAVSAGQRHFVTVLPAPIQHRLETVVTRAMAAWDTLTAAPG